MKTQALVLQAVDAPFVLTVRRFPAIPQKCILVQTAEFVFAGHRTSPLSTERSAHQDGSLRNLSHRPLHPKRCIPLRFPVDCRPRRLWNGRRYREGRDESRGGRFGVTFLCVLWEMWDL